MKRRFGVSQAEASLKRKILRFDISGKLIFEDGKYPNRRIQSNFGSYLAEKKRVGKKEGGSIFISKNTSADVPKKGLEPSYLSVPEPKSGVSTNSTTWAMISLKDLKFREFLDFCQYILRPLETYRSLLAFGIPACGPGTRPFKAACIEHRQLRICSAFSGFKIREPKPKSIRCFKCHQYIKISIDKIV